jgi:hypothetical protein
MDGVELWLNIAAISTGAALTIGTLYVLAVRVRDECELHDLIVEAHTLRLKQARRLSMLCDDEGDVEIVDVEPAGEIAPAAEAKLAA